ncbi:protein kinase [Streptomyces sp. NPDC058307]|uniref:serine/threonine-protein kinase n=1 Tax=Streptomyces sp. NPDC058307 TaxID=3346439 RepID=UPI0036E0B4FD
MGEVFAGRYELADPIGRGGVGAVWRAWDHRRRRYVAAKVLLQSDAHSLLRFVREQALRIDHPHVLAPASWAADDDKVLFTMDLVAGGSLVHLVGDYGPLPPAFVCTLLDQLLAGLAAMHAEGVVHRDIKPANILLEATGTARPRLRLSDFGIAMRLGEPRLTETNLVVGTPGYLAPEQMMGAEPDFPADLFAVGLVALYLLEGAKPDAKALIQYFAAHGTPGAPQSVPEPLWQVVASLLQPDPQARFRTATGARKALAAARELLPDPGPDDESIEIFDQLGPLPPEFGPEGPFKRAPGVDPSRTRNGGSGTGGGARFGTGDGSGGSFGGGGGAGAGVGGARAGFGGVARDAVAGAGAGGAAEPSAGLGSGAGAGAGEVSGAGAGPGARTGDIGGADGVPSWPVQGSGMVSRPGPAGGASSWFGAGNGVGSPPAEAGNASSRSGDRNEQDAFHPGAESRAPSWPGDESQAPSWPDEGNGLQSWPGPSGGTTPPWPAGANSASWPRESNPAPWSEQANPPSWSQGANPPSWHHEAGPLPSPGADASSPATDRGTPWSAPTSPPSVSDTGSFHLPPPRPTNSRSQRPSTPPEHQAQPHQPHQQAQAQPHRPATPAAHPPYDPTPPTHVLPSPQHHTPRFPTQAPTSTPAQQHAGTSTASYTAQSPQVPPPAPSLSRARRSGPPAKVAIPLLLLALVCYAVGFWALTQI